MEEEQYDAGACIIRQGTVGDHFFIIKSGKASVRRDMPNGEQEEVAVLEAGCYFGERALIKVRIQLSHLHVSTVTLGRAT